MVDMGAAHKPSSPPPSHPPAAEESVSQSISQHLKSIGPRRALVVEELVVADDFP